MWYWLVAPLALAAPVDAPRAGAAPEGCTYASLGDVTQLPAPAVIVLGERKGHQPDLRRAERVVSRLAKAGTVTLALEAVHRDAQSVLDRYATGGMIPTDLPPLLQWEQRWGFPWSAYEDLVTSAVLGAKVVGAGLDLGSKPVEAQLPLPPGYIHVLSDAMGENPIPVELESDFVATVAYRDHAIATQAISAWDGQGYLVILADRLHVEGGKGVSWQAQFLTQAPVHAFLLADADARCYPGDQILRDLSDLLPF